MKRGFRLAVLAATLFAMASFSQSASASMLIEDLLGLKLQNFGGQDWKVDHQEKKSMRIDCTSCENPIFVNIQLAGRETFGSLGWEAAENAKSNCLTSGSASLQCDTVEGVEIGNVSGIVSTLKIIDGVFIASYILGDSKTLLQIRTKAPTKDEAGDVSRKLFEAIKSEVIVQ